MFQDLSYFCPKLFCIVWLQIKAGLFNSHYVVPIGDYIAAGDTLVPTWFCKNMNHYNK